MHKPVLLKEVLEVLQPKAGLHYVDATFGAGGYSQAILEINKLKNNSSKNNSSDDNEVNNDIDGNNNAKNCIVHAIDQDHEVLSYFKALQALHAGNIFFYNSKFSYIETILPKNIAIDGIIFDIGVSTMQLKNPSRGFSFLHEGPLDMRMDKRDSINAAMIINSFYEKKLASIIQEFSDERKAKKIASAIVAARQKKLLKTTTDLAEIVRSCFPKWNYKIDPATRTFQALRIFINNELGELAIALNSAAKLLAPGGKIIVITFHSLEDRIVKHKFREWTISGQFRLINKKIITPSREELAENISSRSAKLRAIEKL